MAGESIDVEAFMQKLEEFATNIPADKTKNQKKVIKPVNRFTYEPQGNCLIARTCTDGW